VRVRVCSIFSSIGKCLMDNLRPGGVLRWKAETAGLEGRGVRYEKPPPLRL
jgi:hypothetical protein